MYQNHILKYKIIIYFFANLDPTQPILILDLDETLVHAKLHKFSSSSVLVKVHSPLSIKFLNRINRFLLQAKK